MNSCRLILLRQTGRWYATRFSQRRSTTSKTPDEYHKYYKEQLQELQQEREAVFGFTEDETNAWTNHRDSGDGLVLSLDQRLKMFEADPVIYDDKKGGVTTSSETVFTHLTPKGDSATMVDVGSKKVTRRTARARSSVVFPPEVMDAFEINKNKNEMVGPKGAIFATAKLAGIMGAKRTSDLIPLCHPLPLDRVHIEISLEGNVAIIECEAVVTHKTGVEMEALTGASIAALTIYDMVKAVSHKVKIDATRLMSKTGGKRDVHE